jgi:hypothetical protein
MTVDVSDRNLLDRLYPVDMEEKTKKFKEFIHQNTQEKLTQSPRFIGFPSTITFAE